MADGKWISGLTPAMSVEEAARVVLAARLEIVRHYLPLAVGEPEKDVEHVHHLRVSTRRAGAAIRIFKDCLPGGDRKKLRQRLRAIRRAAGEARDWDVFLLDLHTRAEAATQRQRPGYDFLIGYATAQRESCQEHLEGADPDAGESLRDLIKETLEKLHAPKDDSAPRTLGELAQPLLSHLWAKIEEQVQGDLEDYEHLHQVRILGKRLRYAMEVFADCYPLAFKQALYPAIEEMQEVLGNANDSHVATERIGALRDRLQAWDPRSHKRYRPALDALLRFHQRRVPQERKRFLKWWKDWHEDVGQTLCGKAELGRVAG
jgi:CHAD domain-containing protein